MSYCTYCNQPHSRFESCADYQNRRVNTMLWRCIAAVAIAAAILAVVDRMYPL